jgi:tellurite methyltransferase
MNERLLGWNQRYAAGEGSDLEPSPLLVEAVRDLAPGRALDVASGAGRHALHLAALGWQVLAVDGADAGVAFMQAEAARRGLTIEGRVADLMHQPRGFAPEPGAYDLVCCFYFLDRTLFAELARALRPGGLLVAAIHTASEPGTRLLVPGELGQIIGGLGLTIEREQELPGQPRDTSFVVARR